MTYHVVMSELALYSLYAVPASLAVLVYVWRQRRISRMHEARLREAQEHGLAEPASLHPVFDPVKCIGSQACVKACPEHAIGIVRGKGALVDAAACIGHGACKASCPHDAIRLVFGTAKRGVDIPHVKPTFETNVPGIFIAGELGGMGLIRKAVEQGCQSIESIAALKDGSHPLDVVIIGAGPAGLAASLAAMERKLRSVTIEQESSLGGTVFHYPRNKVVMTSTVRLPIVGKVKMTETSKEELLEFWEGITRKTDLKVNFFERMEKIRPDAGGFVVQTSKREYRARSVLLAIGRRGTPRKLDVPGEEQPKVVYRLVDPQQYRAQHVLVVGGGDSAIEAALACAGVGGTTVTLSYRGEGFSRVKPKNRERLTQAEANGRIKTLLESNITRILADTVVVQQRADTLEFKNDAVIVCAGGVLPTPFLKDLGIMIETKHGTE